MSFKKQLSSTFRRSLLVAIPVAATVGLTVVVYAGSVPNTFSSGESLSAAQMNANFQSLQNQINAIVPTYVGSSQDEAAVSATDGTEQFVPAASFSVTPSVDVNCVATSTCQMPTTALSTSPTDVTYLTINQRANGAEYHQVGLAGFFAAPEGNGISQTVTGGFAASAGVTYTLATGISELGGSASVPCFMTVVCGGAATALSTGGGQQGSGGGGGQQSGGGGGQQNGGGGGQEDIRAGH